MSNMGRIAMARMEERWADPEVRYFSDYSDPGIKRAPRRTTVTQMDERTERMLRALFDITPIVNEEGGEVNA